MPWPTSPARRAPSGTCASTRGSRRRMPSSRSPTTGRVCRRVPSRTPSGVGGRRRSRAARVAAASGWRSWARRSTGSAGRSRCQGRRARPSPCGCPPVKGLPMKGSTAAGATMTEVLRVLVVEDEPIAAEAHTAYVGRVDGFEVVATVGTSQAALKTLQDKEIDVVLLDMNLPDRHGLDVVRAMRAAGHRADVIAVTSARDLDVVRAAVSLGIVQYVLKPFVFATLRDRLLAYRGYRDELVAAVQVGTQAEVDEMLGRIRAVAPSARPKGMSEELLRRVTRLLREAPGGLSAREVGDALGV